jgi:predicted CXXCH cytochrome family protein
MLNMVYKPAVLLICVLISSGFAVEKPTTLQKTCVTEECHAEYGKKAYVHGPVSLGDCTACHKPLNPEEHTWQFERKGKDLCEYCHLEQAARKVVHEPVKTGDCSECHDPHSSDNKFLIPEKTVAALCENCHKVTEGLAFLHGPTAVGECTVCHNSHSTDYAGLLIAEQAGLCFSCHVIMQDELKEYDFVHEPVKNDCIGCHNPHGAANSKMVKSLAPFLCYTCHKDIQKIAENSKYQHSIVGDIDGCLSCHTPHASTIKFLLEKDAKSLCLTCHDKPLELGPDEVLPSFAAELEGKKFLHGPVAENDCSGCHVTHGGEYFRLLAKEYPSEFYAPFRKENYDLCFSCHSEELVLTKETSDLTDFRNGDLNLHYLHVNKPRRGRTCRSCHATHASSLPKHIRESVPYGTWSLPIGFTKKQTGGSCSPGCHLPRDYDRKNPVVYSSLSAEQQ